MAGIPISRLGAADRRRLVERRLSVDELEELHAALLRGQRARARRLRSAALLYIAIAVALLAMTCSKTGPTPAVGFAAVAVAAMGIVCFAVVWAAAIGVFAREFNRAIDEGYPELMGRLHL